MRSREVPITEQIAHCTFMCELTESNFYQCNCVDLKPVPIIQFIFQFEFRIVWDLNPSGFNFDHEKGQQNLYYTPMVGIMSFQYHHFGATYFVAGRFLHRLFQRQFGAL